MTTVVRVFVEGESTSDVTENDGRPRVSWPTHLDALLGGGVVHSDGDDGHRIGDALRQDQARNLGKQLILPGGINVACLLTGMNDGGWGRTPLLDMIRDIGFWVRRQRDSGYDFVLVGTICEYEYPQSVAKQNWRPFNVLDAERRAINEALVANSFGAHGIVRLDEITVLNNRHDKQYRPYDMIHFSDKANRVIADAFHETILELTGGPQTTAPPSPKEEAAVAEVIIEGQTWRQHFADNETVRIPFDPEAPSTLLAVTLRGTAQNTNNLAAVQGFELVSAFEVPDSHCPRINLFARAKPFKPTETYSELRAGETTGTVTPADPKTEFVLANAGSALGWQQPDQLNLEAMVGAAKSGHANYGATSIDIPQIDGQHVVVVATNSTSVPNFPSTYTVIDAPGWWSAGTMAIGTGGGKVTWGGADSASIVAVPLTFIDRDIKVGLISRDTETAEALWSVDWDGGPPRPLEASLTVTETPPDGQFIRAILETEESSHSADFTGPGTQRVLVRVTGDTFMTRHRKETIAKPSMQFAYQVNDNVRIPDWWTFEGDPTGCHDRTKTQQTFYVAGDGVAKGSGKGTESSPWHIFDATDMVAAGKIPGQNTVLQFVPGEHNIHNPGRQFHCAGEPTGHGDGYLSIVGPEPGEGWAGMKGEMYRFWSFGTGSKYVQTVRLKAEHTTMNQKLKQHYNRLSGDDRNISKIASGGPNLNPGCIAFQYDGWDAMHKGRPDLAPHHHVAVNDEGHGTGEIFGSFESGQIMAFGSAGSGAAHFSPVGRSNFSWNAANASKIFDADSSPIFVDQHGKEWHGGVWGCLSWHALQLVASWGIGMGDLISDGNSFIVLPTDFTHGSTHRSIGRWVAAGSVGFATSGMGATGYSGAPDHDGDPASWILAMTLWAHGMNNLIRKGQLPAELGDWPTHKAHVSRGGGQEIWAQHYDAHKYRARTVANSNAVDASHSDGSIGSWGDAMRIEGTNNVVAGGKGASVGHKMVDSLGLENQSLTSDFNPKPRSDSPLLGAGRFEDQLLPVDLFGQKIDPANVAAGAAQRG